MRVARFYPIRLLAVFVSALAIFTFGLSAAAQIPSGYVQTTATVPALANATYGAAWTNLSSSTQLGLLGCVSTFQQTVNGKVNSYGTFTTLLADTAQICPSPSTWTFTFTFSCPAGQTPGGFTVAVAVTGGGTTEDISSQIAAALPATPCGGAIPSSYVSKTQTTLQTMAGPLAWSPTSAATTTLQNLSGLSTTDIGTQTMVGSLAVGSSTPTTIGASGINSGIPALGQELIPDPTFSNASQWSATAGNWTVAGSSGTVNTAATVSNSSSNLYIYTGASSGTIYKVVYTLASVSQGSIQCGLGGSTAPTANCAFRSSAGTYTDYLTADSSSNGNLVFTPVNFTGSISLVSLRAETTYVQGLSTCRDAANNLFYTSSCPSYFQGMPLIYPGLSVPIGQFLAGWDSITAGYGGASPVPYTNYIVPYLGGPENNYLITNVGVPGQTCANVLKNIAHYTAQWANNTRTNVAVSWCGTNDFAGGADVAQTFQSFAAVNRALQQAGYKVVVVPMLSRTAQDTNKAAYNQLIREQWPSFADALADSPAMWHYLECDGCNSNSTYFDADDTHPTQLSQQTIIAPAIGAAVTYVTRSKTSALYTFGTDLVTNGSFSSGSGWTLGTNWSVSGGAAVSIGSNGGQSVYQNIGLLTSGVLYAVTYTIESYTSGILSVYFGGSLNPSAYGPGRSALGTYTDFILADSSVNGNIIFNSYNGSPFIGSFSFVSVKPVGSPTIDGDTCSTAAGMLYRSSTCNSSGTSGNLVQWGADGTLTNGPVPPSGAIVGTTDTQALTNKTVAVPSARKNTFVCTAGGTITITNTNYIATSDVVITMNTSGGTITTPPAMKTVTPGVGFTVLCGASDTSTYNYSIWN